MPLRFPLAAVEHRREPRPLEIVRIAAGGLYESTFPSFGRRNGVEELAR